MLRAVLSVIIGYIVMFILVFATFTAVYLAMGPDRAFKPGTYDVSMMWTIVSLALGTLAAMVGGAVCARIARTSTPPKVLAGLALVLGLIMAVPVIMDSGAEQPATRPAQVDNLTAMQNAKQPVAMAILNPVIGAVGVLIGAAMVGRKAGPRPVA